MTFEFQAEYPAIFAVFLGEAKGKEPEQCNP